MVTVDGGHVIIFNGEIYNFAELRAELVGRGYKFVTDHSDTEVMLHGFREWGAGLAPPDERHVDVFDVIYDRAARKLFASRDRFGKKPFYYTVQNGAFVFGSELSALRAHPAVRSGVSKRSLKKYFGYGYIPAPHSILENVFKLPGGHSLWLDCESLAVRVEKYWDFVLEPFAGSEIPANPEQAWGEELRARLDAAVKCRLVADVPVGIFLSGGIDSSAVTAFASRHVPAGRLKTFSIGFEEASFDESAHARRVAEFFKTDHYLETLSIAKAHSLLPVIAAKLDEPMGDSSLLPTYLLSEFTRKHVTVALGGDAGGRVVRRLRSIRRAAQGRALCETRARGPCTVPSACSRPACRSRTATWSFDFKLKRTAPRPVASGRNFGCRSGCQSL